MVEFLILASGAKSPPPTLTVELVEAAETPSVVLLGWSAPPSVADRIRFPATANRIVRERCDCGHRSMFRHTNRDTPTTMQPWERYCRRWAGASSGVPRTSANNGGKDAAAAATNGAEEAYHDRQHEPLGGAGGATQSGPHEPGQARRHLGCVRRSGGNRRLRVDRRRLLSAAACRPRRQQGPGGHRSRAQVR